LIISVTIPERRNSNDLPDDIFSYNEDIFYKFVKKWYGHDLAELFTFQAIRNGSHLVNSTVEDVLSVLQYESNDIDYLKNLCCFRIGNDQFQVKLGIKLAINNLISLLNIKQEQEKKKKRSSIRCSTSDNDAPTSINQTQFGNQTIPSSSTSLTPTNNDVDTTGSTLTAIKNGMNEIGHILDIKDRIDKWCTTSDINNISLDEGSHYSLEINKSINNTYACVLTCQCEIRFKLSFLSTGYFKLSSFYRHLKEQCIPFLNMVNISPNEDNFYEFLYL
jgi:hypothetical protein